MDSENIYKFPSHKINQNSSFSLAHFFPVSSNLTADVFIPLYEKETLAEYLYPNLIKWRLKVESKAPFHVKHSLRLDLMHHYLKSKKVKVTSTNFNIFSFQCNL